jgi:hypothetical protein
VGEARCDEVLHGTRAESAPEEKKNRRCLLLNGNGVQQRFVWQSPTDLQADQCSTE